MEIERGLAGKIQYAAVGSGSPVVIAAGLWPTTSVHSNRFVHGVLAPLQPLQAQRLLIVFNRRRALPTGTSMSDLAAEYAEAIRVICRSPVDLVGTSTGGSIVQQLAAEHPDTVPSSHQHRLPTRPGDPRALEPSRRVASRRPDALCPRSRRR